MQTQPLWHQRGLEHVAGNRTLQSTNAEVAIKEGRADGFFPFQGAPCVQFMLCSVVPGEQAAVGREYLLSPVTVYSLPLRSTDGF